MRRVALLVAAGALVVVSVAAAGGTTRHPIPTAGISLATPSSWRTVDSRSGLASRGVKALRAANPQLAPLIRFVAGGNGFKFLACDPHVSDRVPTTVIVSVSTLLPGVTFATLATGVPPQLRKTPGLVGKVTTSIVKLSVSPALVASYRVSSLDVRRGSRSCRRSSTSSCGPRT